MQIHSFTGTNTQEVMALIKAEMGSDAVILSSRSFRKGGVRRHEVTAGLERPAMEAGGAADGVMPPGWSEWHKDWMIIKNQLHALMKPALRLERLRPRQRLALEYLQREGISDDVALELYNRLTAESGLSILEPLDDMMPVRPWSRVLWKERTHILTGPFGADKTTSGLRAALHLRGEMPELKIAFINADCARGTGRLVLRHWAELSAFDYHEAPDAEGMRKALRACAEADMIFVDMPGLDRESALPEQLGALGADTADTAVHLVLTPHYAPVQLSAFLARYRSPHKYGLVCTKLNEAACYGSILNVSHASGLPISALSYGPGLRGSLCPASAFLLRRLLFKRQLPGGNAPETGTAPEQRR